MEVVKILETYKGSNSFIISVKTQFENGRKLSQKQISAVENAFKRESEYLARKSAREEKMITPPEGQQHIVGKVLGFKKVEGYQYHTYVTKARIESPLGFTLYGTVPKSIIDEVEVGDKVSLTVKVYPKQKGFGFYSYPKNAKIINEIEWKEYLEESKEKIVEFQDVEELNKKREEKESIDRKMMDVLTGI